MSGIIRDITPIQATEIFSLFGFSIANSTLFIMLIAVIILAFGYFGVRKFSVANPGRLQVGVEAVYLSAFDLVQNIINSEEKTKKVFPIIGAMMFYLAIANIIGLFPGLEQISFDGKEIFRTPTSDFNTTFGLALAAVVIINIISYKEKGFFGYFDQFFKFKGIWQGFKKSIGDGFMAIIDFFIGLLDIVGEFTKVISLSLRLFWKHVRWTSFSNYNHGIFCSRCSVNLVGDESICWSFTSSSFCLTGGLLLYVGHCCGRGVIEYY